MKHTMQFSVSDEVVSVPQDEMDEFNAAAQQRGYSPDPVFSYRVTGKDGATEDVQVPKSQFDEFKAASEERGYRFDPLRRFTMDDGTERTMSMSELRNYFRSPEYRNSPDGQLAREKKRALDAETRLMETRQPSFLGEIGRNLVSADAVRDMAEDNPSARPYAYANDLANALVGGLLKGSAKISEGFGRIVGSDAIVKSAQADQAAVDQALPTDMLDTSGGGAANKVLQVGKNVAAVTGEFAPAAIPGVGQAYAASLVGGGATVRFAQVYDDAIEHGVDPQRAVGLASLGAGVDALGNMLLMGKFKGVWSGEEKALADAAKRSLVRRLVGDTAKTGAIMSGQGMAGDVIDQTAEGNVRLDWKRTGKVGFDQFIEGGLFHLVNSGAHAATRIDWGREAKGIPDGAARDMMEAPEGRALIFANSPDAARSVFHARRRGEDVSRRMIRELGLPDSIARTVHERNAIGDRLMADYDAFKERVRTKMDDVQAEALADEIASRSDEGVNNPAFEKVWFKAVEQIKDAAELDDPERRAAIVDEAVKNTESFSDRQKRELAVKRYNQARAEENVEFKGEEGAAEYERREAERKARELAEEQTLQPQEFKISIDWPQEAKPQTRTEEWPEYADWLKNSGKTDTDKNWNRFVAENELDLALRVDRRKDSIAGQPEAEKPVIEAKIDHEGPDFVPETGAEAPAGAEKPVQPPEVAANPARGASVEGNPTNDTPPAPSAPTPAPVRPTASVPAETPEAAPKNPVEGVSDVVAAQKHLTAEGDLKDGDISAPVGQQIKVGDTQFKVEARDEASGTLTVSDADGGRYEISENGEVKEVNHGSDQGGSPESAGARAQETPPATQGKGDGEAGTDGNQGRTDGGEETQKGGGTDGGEVKVSKTVTDVKPANTKADPKKVAKVAEKFNLHLTKAEMNNPGKDKGVNTNLLKTYHDPDGHLVATDGRIIISTTHGFDKAKADADKASGRTYPNWRHVVPDYDSLSNRSQVNPKAILAVAKEATKLARDTGNDPDRVFVRVKVGDNDCLLAAFNATKMAEAMDAAGMTELATDARKNYPVVAHSKTTDIVLMPVRMSNAWDNDIVIDAQTGRLVHAPKFDRDEKTGRMKEDDDLALGMEMRAKYRTDIEADIKRSPSYRDILDVRSGKKTAEQAARDSFGADAVVDDATIKRRTELYQQYSAIKDDAELMNALHDYFRGRKSGFNDAWKRNENDIARLEKYVAAVKRIEELRDAEPEQPVHADKPVEKPTEAAAPVEDAAYVKWLHGLPDTPKRRAEYERSYKAEAPATADKPPMDGHEANVAKAAEIISNQTNKNKTEKAPPSAGTISWAESLVKEIENKNADALRRRFNGLNKGSVKAFEAITGLKMPNTQKGQHEVVDRFCGITPEQRAEIDAKRKADADAKVAAEKQQKIDAANKEWEAKYDGFMLDATPMKRGQAERSLSKQYRYDGKVMTQAEHVKNLIGEGWRVEPFTATNYKTGKETSGFRIVDKDGSFYEIPKVAYEYGKYLTEKQVASSETEKTTPDKQPSMSGIEKANQKEVAFLKKTFPDFERQTVVNAANFMAGNRGIFYKHGEVAKLLKERGHQIDENAKEDVYQKQLRKAMIDEMNAEGSGGKEPPAKGGEEVIQEKPNRSPDEIEVAKPVDAKAAAKRLGITAYLPSDELWQELGKVRRNADRDPRMAARAADIEAVLADRDAKRPISRLAAALNLADRNAYGEAMEMLRRDIENGAPFPSAEDVDANAASLPEKQRTAFVKNMDAWRKYAEERAADVRNHVSRQSTSLIDPDFTEWAKRQGVKPDAKQRQTYDRIRNERAVKMLRRFIPNVKVEFADRPNEQLSADERAMAIVNVGGKNVAVAIGYVGGTDPKSVSDYIRNNTGLVSTIMETGLPVELGGNLPREYARSKYSRKLQENDRTKWDDKARFVPSLGEMIEIAENRRWEKESHPHNKPSHFKYGFYRFDSTVAVPDGNGGFRAYDVELVINNHANGKHYLYDVVNIKENARLSGLTATEIQSRSEAKALHSSRTVANPSADVNADPEVRASRIHDPELIRSLENGKTVKVFRAMQMIDGKLYPPMAAKVQGKMVDPIELGVWEKADERPDLIKNGKFTLNKANGASIQASYNPYLHTSRSPLNDQFSSAYKRPNLVTVEVEVPESELTSGYKAEGAKDAVGEMTWHSGPVSSKLPPEKSRRVILSRYDKPVRIVPDAEVADRVAEMLRGENITVPSNTVTPSLLNELVKRGVLVDTTPTDVRNLHDRATGAIVGTYDRRTNRVTLYHGANLETVMHEMGGHALWQYAEQHPELKLKEKLAAYADETPQELKDAIAADYATDGLSPESLVDEIFSGRFGREKSGKVAEALRREAGRKWYQKVWDAIKGAWRAVVSRFGGNRVDTDALDGMTPDEAVDYMAAQMVAGKTLGRVEPSRGAAASAPSAKDTPYITQKASGGKVHELLQSYLAGRADADSAGEVRKSVGGEPAGNAEAELLSLARENGVHLGGVEEVRAKVSGEPFADGQVDKHGMETISVKRDGDKDSDIRYARGGSPSPAPAAKPVFDDPQSKAKNLREQYQDSRIKVRDFEEKVGITDKAKSAYHAADRKNGLIEHQFDKLERDFIAPISRSIGEQGIDPATFDRYLVAEHAAERNAVVASRGGGQGASMTDAEAQQFLDDLRARGEYDKYHAIGEKVWAMNQEALDRALSSGRISQQYHDQLTNQWSHYVPLRFDMENEELDTFNRSIGGWRKDEYAKAKGHTEEEDSPLIFSFMQAEQSIKAANENIVRQKVAENFETAEKRGFDAGKIYKGRQMKKTWAFDIGKDVITADEGFNERDRDDLIFFKRDGDLYAVVVNPGKHGGGLDYARAITGKNMPQLGAFWRGVRSFTQWKARMRTSLVPTFIGRNFKNDAFETQRHLDMDFGVVEGKKIMASVAKWEAKNAPAVMAYAKDGKLTGGYVQEYVENGGLIGGGVASNYADQAKRIRKDIGYYSKHGLTVSAFRAAMKGIQILNELAENSTRIGVYSALRERGMSVEDAISWARDNTGNFNRKGTKSDYTNSLWMFSNAAVQGHARDLHGYKNAAEHGAGRLASNLLQTAMVGTTLALLAHYFGNDEEREKAGASNARNETEYAKQTQMSVPVGGGKKAQWGMRGLAASEIYAARKIAEVILGDTDAGDAAVELAKYAGDQLTSVVGGNGLDSPSKAAQTVSPAHTDMLVQMALGKDYKDDDLYRRKFNEYDPDSWNGSRKTPEIYAKVAQALNAVTGGNEHRKGKVDLAPETIKLFAEELGGGVMRDIDTAYQAVKGAVDTAKGDAPDDLVGSIPFVRDTVRKYPSVSGRFWEAYDRYKADKNDHDGADPKRQAELEKEHPYLKAPWEKRGKEYVRGSKTAVDRLFEKHQDLQKQLDGNKQGWDIRNGKYVKGDWKPYEWPSEDKARFRSDMKAIEAKILKILGG